MTTPHAIAFKVSTRSRSRRLTNSSTYVHKSYTLRYQTEDTIWHEYPDTFSDRSQATRLGNDLMYGHFLVQA